MSDTLNLPIQALRDRPHGPMIVMTSQKAGADERRRYAEANVELLAFGTSISGKDICDVARGHKLETVYSIGGPRILHTSASAGALRRLYVSIALRLIAGDRFDTLLCGGELNPPLNTNLSELYLDPQHEATNRHTSLPRST